MGCYADVTAFLDGECSGKQSCKVMVGTMDAVAQPCPKDFKSYLEATYTCVPGTAMVDGSMDQCENRGMRE